MQNKNYYDPLSGGVITNSFKEKNLTMLNQNANIVASMMIETPLTQCTLASK